MADVQPIPVDTTAMQKMMNQMQTESLKMQEMQMKHSAEMEKISGLAQAAKGGDETKKQITQNFK